MSKHDVAHIPHLTSHIARPQLVAVFLFIIALLPRLPGLGLFLTSDENTNIFFAGSDVIVAFLRGDFRGTYWHFYPGVTMSWLDALGMAGQYLFASLSGAKLPPFEEYVYGDILSLLVANRLPYAILTAAAVPAIYLLARRLLPGRIALLGALFLAFDPFYLAHSRVAHGDAPLAVFMSLSALTFFIYIKRANEAVSQRIGEKQSSLSSLILRPSSFLITSAIFGGLAGLTKAPGPFMALFISGMSIIYMGVELYQAAGSKWQTVGITPGAPHSTFYVPRPRAKPPLGTPHASFVIIHWLKVVVVWGLIALAVFMLLWPAMWVDPAGTVGRMWAETFGKVNEGHLVYFFGQPTLDPGPWFYFYIIPFRLTPIVLIGALLSLALLIPKIRSFADSEKPTLYALRLTPLFLWLFILSLLLFGNLSPKKQDRYLLPLFPFLDLLAAVGWVGLFNLAQYFMRPKTSSSIYLLLPTGLYGPLRAYSLLLVFHFIPTITYYPYYLTYFNPLMGGPVRAAQTTLLGWGEGMEQAAAYLNTKPNAERLYVASTPSQTLLPYFAGVGENFYTNDIAFRADYVVLYLAQMQRLAPSPEIINYFQAQEPEKTIIIHGVTYAKIYPGPKLILTDIPPDAIPVNIGLNDVIRLAGYKISNLQLSLYWHILSPLSTNYTISVRARAADGRLLVQQDSQPVHGLLPTSLWRQGDYVADTYTLGIPPADKAKLTYFEVVVYNAATAETLGPPITLPLPVEE